MVHADFRRLALPCIYAICRIRPKNLIEVFTKREVFPQCNATNLGFRKCRHQCDVEKFSCRGNFGCHFPMSKRDAQTWRARFERDLIKYSWMCSCCQVFTTLAVHTTNARQRIFRNCCEGIVRSIISDRGKSMWKKLKHSYSKTNILKVLVPQHAPLNRVNITNAMPSKVLVRTNVPKVGFTEDRFFFNGGLPNVWNLSKSVKRGANWDALNFYPGY